MHLPGSSQIEQTQAPAISSVHIGGKTTGAYRITSNDFAKTLYTILPKSLRTAAVWVPLTVTGAMRSTADEAQLQSKK